MHPATNSDLLSFEPLHFASAELKPVLITPKTHEVDLAAWVSARRTLLEAKLIEHAVILFRDFSLDEDDFLRFLDAAFPERVAYEHWSTPRTEIGERVYTSTEYPATHEIPLHAECVYTRAWPAKLIFYCSVPPKEGGETPLASTRAITRRIPQQIRDQFERRGVLYVRNYRPSFDIPWQKAFQTSSSEELARYCRQEGIDHEWRGLELRTRHVCQGLANHPLTGELLWCNQAHLFHSTSLEPSLRQALLKTFPDDLLPRNAFYGDGTPIDDDTLATIRSAYEDEAVALRWKKGDVLIIDNMLAQHGRKPFRGARRILAAFDGSLRTKRQWPGGSTL